MMEKLQPNEKKCPLISIIVPIYNVEKYIYQCVDSILAQTYTNLEIILVDDGSPDNCPKICDDYAMHDARVKVIHKKNGGVSSARNKGIDLSSGELLTFLDADDQLPIDACEQMLEKLLQYNADIVAGKVEKDVFRWKYHDDFFIWKGEEGLKNSLLDNPFTYSAWGKIYKKEFVNEIRFREDIKINEDSLFVFEVLCKKPIFVGINKEVYIYNSNPSSASRAVFSAKFFDIALVSEIKYNVVKSNYPDLKKYAENMKVKADMNLLKLLAYRSASEYVGQEKNLISEIKCKGKFFKPITYRDCIWFLIIVLGLYRPFKALHRK